MSVAQRGARWSVSVFRCAGRGLLVNFVVACCLTALASSARAQEREPEAPALPAPLDVGTVVRLAGARRAEIAAANARAGAASERPAIVSALPDPMVIGQINHVPLDFHSIFASLTVQQEIPLSGVLGNRRRAAEADADHWSAETHRVALDVELEALQAFFALAARRATTSVLDDQIAITEQLLVIARAHYGAGQGTEADVLRLENEAARFRSDRQALDADIRGAEAALDTVLARDLHAPIPALAWNDEVEDPPTLATLVAKAVANRPELAATRAERRSALADVDVMKSMYQPVALLRAGPAYMTANGPGAMLVVGLSVPIWRDRLAAGVNEAQSTAAMRGAELAAIDRIIRGDVAVAREEVLAERTRLLAIQQDILPRARRVVSSAMGSFAAGQGAMLAVLDPTRDLLAIRLEEITARRRLSVAWAKLRRATGE
jgi:cobalt-zinc-cadmium efflux system outer membrane protein